MKRQFWRVLGVLLLAGLGWLLWRMEWVELDQGAEPTAAAKRNPYLAAEQFIQAQGRAVRNEMGLHQLKQAPEQGEVLWLIDAYGALSRDQAEELLNWVWDGGLLIMTGQNPYRGPESLDADYLFDFFGVEVTRPTARTNQATVIDAILGLASDCGSWMDPAAVRFMPGGEQIQVGFPEPSFLRLEQAQDALVLSDHRGPRLAQFDYGAGRVTLLADSRLWTNPYISCRDNAYLLWRLVGDGQSVRILRNQEAISLWQLLWQHAGWSLGLTLALVLLYLWRQGVRFGPVVVEETGQRRRFMEHIQASARFLWRHRQVTSLLEPLRAEIETRLTQRVPGYGAWPEARRYEEIARLTGLPESVVAQAMTATPQDETRLTYYVQDLQTIRNNL